jgi:hypothetical protein
MAYKELDKIDPRSHGKNQEWREDAHETTARIEDDTAPFVSRRG